LAHARREARLFEGEGKQETFNDRNHGMCGAECFNIFIRSTPLPKGKLSDGIVKFNGQQDSQIWLDDFLTAVTIGGGSRDNALQLLSLHMKDNERQPCSREHPFLGRILASFHCEFLGHLAATYLV
jgi:hypothetical protein